MYGGSLREADGNGARDEVRALRLQASKPHHCVRGEITSLASECNCARGALVSDAPAHPVRCPSRSAHTIVADIHRVIATFLIKQAWLKRGEAYTGAVTLIKRFGSAASRDMRLACLGSTSLEFYTERLK